MCTISVETQFSMFSDFSVSILILNIKYPLFVITSYCKNTLFGSVFSVPSFITEGLKIIKTQKDWPLLKCVGFCASDTGILYFTT